jgi:DNA repair exonuclease SbcCD ATPase subunit
MSNDNEKINILMEKLNKLELTLKDERKLRLKLEEEIKNYKTTIIPSIEKDLEDKESLCKSAFIEKIRLERVILEKFQKTNEVAKINNDLFLENEKNSYINKLEFYQNAYKESKLKLKTLEDEKNKIEVDFNKRLEIEKEKNNILKRQLEDKESKIETLNTEMINLSLANKDLITELKAINTILDTTSKFKEINSMELAFYKNEVELL